MRKLVLADSDSLYELLKRVMVNYAASTATSDAWTWSRCGANAGVT